jgi:hypothetical protein
MFHIVHQAASPRPSSSSASTPSGIQLVSGIHIVPDVFDWRGPIASAFIPAGWTRVY